MIQSSEAFGANKPQEPNAAQRGFKSKKPYLGSISEERETFVAQQIEDRMAELKAQGISSKEQAEALQDSEEMARKLFHTNKLKELAYFTDEEMRILVTAEGNPGNYHGFLSIEEIGKLTDLFERKRKAEALLVEEETVSKRKLEA